MTFKEWLIDKCLVRGIGYMDAEHEVDSFLSGNFSNYTARVRAILHLYSGELARRDW